MSNPPKQQQHHHGRQRNQAPDPNATPRIKTCKFCKSAPALPDDDACERCGDLAIERARAGVDNWLGMQAQRVIQLGREEQERAEAARAQSAE